jgi:hypothetical protein
MRDPMVFLILGLQSAYLLSLLKTPGLFAIHEYCIDYPYVVLYAD